MNESKLLELLLASKVRELAAELRTAAARAAHADSGGQALFKAAHPLTEFAPAAMHELEAITLAMRAT